MHKDDQMTPMERLGGFLSGGEMDRILAMPFIMSVSGDAAGMTHAVKRATARNEADAQIASYKKFGNDLLMVEYGLHNIGKSMGTTMVETELAVPHIKDRCLKNLEDYDKLPWEKCLMENSPFAKQELECLDILIDEMGSEVPTGVLISNAFTAITSVYPVDKVLKACRRQPEIIHSMLRSCTDVLKSLMTEYIKHGAMILLCEPIGSGSIMSSKMWDEFVKPYSKEIIENIHAQGGMVCFHICGDTTKIIPGMIECGPDMISVDDRVDLAFAKGLVEPYMPIVGNVDPVETMVLGGPADVEANVKRCIEAGYDAQHGYILASGCDLNVGVPQENLAAFMDAARKYGKCPVNPANWA